MTSTQASTGVIGSTRTGPTESATDIVNSVAARLQALERMDYAALRSEWRRLYRSRAPNRVARDLLMLGIAWKIQEQAYGGLNAATKRRLATLTRAMERDGDVKRDRVSQLKPGAKLVREWRGKAHTVTVVDDGFEWNGRTWRSLSSIARAMTGVHWSGPRFFGLTNNAVKTASHDLGAADA